MKIAAIILGAGKGTRMNQGVASPVPKVMFKINEKPILHYSIKSIQDAGISNIVVVVGYKKDMIMSYFGKEVDYAVQEEQLGTGHAAMMAKDNLKGKADAVVICYGDMPLYRPETIRNLVQTFQKEKPTIAMLSVDFKRPKYWAYGRIIRDEEGYVNQIIEQRDCNERQLEIRESNPGFYIFDADWFWDNADKLSTNNAQNEYYLTDMIKVARDQDKKIIAVKVSRENEVLGINNPKQLKEVEEIIKSRN